MIQRVQRHKCVERCLGWVGATGLLVVNTKAQTEVTSAKLSLGYRYQVVISIVSVGKSHTRRRNLRGKKTPRKADHSNIQSVYLQ